MTVHVILSIFIVGLLALGVSACGVHVNGDPDITIRSGKSQSPPSEPVKPIVSEPEAVKPAPRTSFFGS